MESNEKPSFKPIPSETSDNPQNLENNTSAEQLIIRRSDLLVNTDQITHPTVFFVGPRKVGKTVVLIRLMKWLKSKGSAVITPNRKFITHKTEGSAYDDVLNEFSKVVKEPYSPPSTGLLNFLLLDAMVGTKKFCQFVEVPGEDYFDPKFPDKTGFEGYLSTLMFHSNRKKVFVFFFEKDFLVDQQQRIAYSERVSSIIKQIKGKTTKVVFLYNKVDLHTELFINGKPNNRTIKDEVLNNPSYVSLKEAIRSNRSLHNPIWVPFSSGTFGEADSLNNYRQPWHLGNPDYPKSLWNAIYNSLKPGWFSWLS